MSTPKKFPPYSVDGEGSDSFIIDRTGALVVNSVNLCPVAAFQLSDGVWRREMEGPEDMDPPQRGRYEELHRAPTYWMPIPALPNDKYAGDPPTKDSTEARK